MVIPSGTNRAVTPPQRRLILDAITRTYGPVRALDAAHLTVYAGEVHALLGENGAGKSTLMKIAFGLERPDAGTVTLDGKAVAFRSPRDAMSHGIGMVQQHFALVDAMTVAENVALGGGGTLDLGATRDTIRRIGEATGLRLDPDSYVHDLPVGARQRLEIVKALARNSTLLILDEPTAVLSPAESTELLRWCRTFAEGGGTVILIAHKLREVLSVADRATVLRRGRTVFEESTAGISEDVLAGAMLGDGATLPVRNPRAATAPTREAPPPDDAPPITLDRVTVTDDRGVTRLRDATVRVARGEIVGVAAIEGAGQRELLRVMAGRLTPTHGTARLPATVGFVPEDRHRDAVVLDATLTENVALRGASERTGLMPWSTMRAETAELMRQRDVRADSEAAEMRTLSGGNQQKLVLGRELAMAPAALIVENPTRGLDIRATADVHAALRAARDEGTAVVVYSSDLDEVLALADRVLVMTGGRLRTDVPNDRDAVGRAMLGGSA